MPRVTPRSIEDGAAPAGFLYFLILGLSDAINRVIPEACLCA